MVASATTKAMANDCARLCGFSVKKRSKRLCSVAKIRAESDDEHRAEPDARCDPECGRHERVEPAFGRECADELGAAHPDGAGHAELGLALGGEHHEEVHEQQQAGEHAEAAHRREHRREALADRLGDIERRPLDRIDLGVESARRGSGPESACSPRR